MKKLIIILLVTLFTTTFYGCTSGRVNITPTPSDSYQKLGRVEGKACGALGLLGTAYYFVPMGINGRYERAYEDALAKVPGATGIIDVTISEDWYWWVLCTARCVTLSGEAVK